MNATQIPTNEALAALRARLARRAGGVLESLAAEHGVPLRTVIGCLPQEMWSETGGEHFCEVMAEVTSWGPVTLIVHSEDGVFEFAGPLPAGTLGRGFFNLHGASGLSGHLRAERRRSIVFLRRPFMGRPTASIQFFNAAGGAMFKIFVGRDAAGALCASQLARFDALERRLAKPASG